MQYMLGYKGADVVMNTFCSRHAPIAVIAAQRRKISALSRFSVYCTNLSIQLTSPVEQMHWR